MQGARPIYIYRLAPCTENCSQRISKTFSLKYLEEVHFFSTFEPKKHKSVFQAAVSTCTLKILCCGYNLATQKKKKVYKELWYKEIQGIFIFLSLRKQGCKSTSYVIYTLYYTRKVYKGRILHCVVLRIPSTSTCSWYVYSYAISCMFSTRDCIIHYDDGNFK